jgi:superfamily II DNA helicase RecQ
MLPPEIETGQVGLILASPEALLEERWRRPLLTYRHRIKLLAFDEAHTIAW